MLLYAQCSLREPLHPLPNSNRLFCCCCKLLLQIQSLLLWHQDVILRYTVLANQKLRSVLNFLPMSAAASTQSL